ncbi:hypothetical protein [Brevibacterium oceani]|uniref:hypothetical protein n=1 Tax=Brevibacterium oceani TaxID=358099 RepID=UPI0015E6C9A3|nr:hypothetical protein [Brevibacterium oceani]
MTVQLDSGSWGLFGGPGARQIVLVDDEPCGPSSARKFTKRIPRELLLDSNRIAKAYETGEAIDEVVEHVDRRWRVVVEPTASPRSNSPMGVLAAVAPVEEALPPRPLVGSWEWEIELDDQQQPTMQRRTYWDRNLYEIYEVDPAVDQQTQGFWETGEWSNELIDRSDQMRVASLVRDGIQEGLAGEGAMKMTGVLRCLTYNVVTGYGAEHRGRKHLRLVGQIVPIERTATTIRIFGFSYEVPETFHDMAFVQDVNAGRVDDVLRGVMSLVKNPMAVVDVETLDVLMTSTSWRNEDFGQVGGLGEFIVEDDCRVHKFIRSAAENTENSTTMPVALRRVDGSVREVAMTVVGVRSGVQGHDAVVRLDL